MKLMMMVKMKKIRDCHEAIKHVRIGKDDDRGDDGGEEKRPAAAVS